MEKLTVLYDGIGFNEVHGGVSRYFTEMLKCLPQDIDIKLAVDATCNEYLQAKPFNVPKARRSAYEFLPDFQFRGKNRFYQILSTMLPIQYAGVERINERCARCSVSKFDYDVLHLTGAHFVGDYWKDVVGKRPIVITIHDLIPEKFGLLRGIRKTRETILNAATCIIAVSNSTKEDIVSKYKVDADKISVVHHGVSVPSDTFDERFAIHGRYILYVGKRAGYKNFAFFIKAVSGYIAQESNLHVVCVGDRFDRCERKFLQELGVGDKVLAVDADDQMMPSIYRNALCLVCPSLSEGFGLPLLEAMASKCPVVATDLPVFREVASDAAIYFTENDSEGLVENIRTLNTNIKSRDAMIAKGLARAGDFSWDRCAKGTAQVYRKAIMEFQK